MISHYFGLPRCGKSTMACMLAKKQLDLIERGEGKYRYVLSNFPIQGCYKHDFEEFGSYDFSDCYMIIDESSIDVDNRDWKSFTKPKLIATVLHGHFNAELIFLSQDPKGIDRKIQSCREKIYWVRKLGQFSFAINLPLVIEVDENHQPLYGVKKPGLFQILTAQKCYRPNYYHMHNSYWKPDLPKKEYEKWTNFY